jgi:lipoprotein-anchoring transpeptidase ErfK/SrfK
VPPPVVSAPVEAKEPPPEVLARALPPARSRILEIDLTTQAFRYFEDDRLVRAGAVSAGTAEHPTPTGRFRVLSKERDKVSRSYTNAFDMPTPMPYSMQFYDTYFIHEGWVPGYADSHGCVRLHYEDARFLFERMKRGDEVIVAGYGGYVGHGGPGIWLAPDDPRAGWW